MKSEKSIKNKNYENWHKNKKYLKSPLWQHLNFSIKKAQGLDVLTGDFYKMFKEKLIPTWQKLRK